MTSLALTALPLSTFNSMMTPAPRATATALWSAAVVQERMIWRRCASGATSLTATFNAGIFAGSAAATTTAAAPSSAWGPNCPEATHTTVPTTTAAPISRLGLKIEEAIVIPPED